MEVIKEEIITFSKARKILEANAKGKELGYEQNNALEYLKKFSKLSDKKTRDMIEELGKISRLKDRQKALIVDFLPVDMDDLRVLLAHEIISLSEDEKKSIIKIVKKYS